MTTQAVTETTCLDAVGPPVFACAVVPLLVYSNNREPELRSAALAGLVQLGGFKAAKNKNSLLVSARRSSSAARCAADTLSIVFSMLNVRDFLVAQRCCHRWRAARLHSASWPGTDLRHHAVMLLSDSLDTQLKSARFFREVLSHHSAIHRIVQCFGVIDTMVRQLGSTNNVLKVRTPANSRAIVH
jgi:hypothetical protein